MPPDLQRFMDQEAQVCYRKRPYIALIGALSAPFLLPKSREK
jgi:hypothetical protein